MPGPPTRPGRGADARSARQSSRRDVPRREDGPEAAAERSPARKRRRSASPDADARGPRRRRHSSHRRRDKADEESGGGGAGAGVQLPYSARPLVKADLQAFGSLFAYYLGVQKRKDAYSMEERELRGRWKRFVRKWNGGELAEGWYDPETFARVSKWEEEGFGEEDEDEEEDGMEEDEMEDGQQGNRTAPGLGPSKRPNGSVDTGHGDRGLRPTASGAFADDNDDDSDSDSDSDDDEGYGPTLPDKPSARRRVGAKIPSLQDLSLRDELIEEGKQAERSALRAARKADRRAQRERLEELAPRAEPRTRERRLEKRREANDRMRQLRDGSPGGGMAEAGGGDKELLGGGDSVDEYRQMKARERRRKSERQVRREELERARREIMDAKRRAWQRREEGTVSMLRELARQRFG